MIRQLYWKCYEKAVALIASVSPSLATKYWYHKANRGGYLNLNNPTTFKEKLSWLKLNTYYNNPLITQCADKVCVRDYVIGCGLGNILNEVIGVYDSFEDIDWDGLPKQFALKCNHGCGYNLICPDKSQITEEETGRLVKGWLKEAYWKKRAEVNYKFIKPQILIEKYLDTNQGFLPYDYKFYCFNGKPLCVLVMMGRGEHMQAAFMDLNYKLITVNTKYSEYMEIPPKPECFADMIRCAEILCKPFPFVRVDLYDNNGNVVFGELTFTNAAGQEAPTSLSWGGMPD